jgi:hypothetical protein
VQGAALVKIVFGELSCAEGLGENDNVNQALMPDARFCVSMSQYALRLIYVSTDVPGMINPICGPIPSVRDSNGHNDGESNGSIGELVEQEALASYAYLCGRTLARAHARSADPAVLAGYMGKRGVFDDALASFAMAYAVRTRKDYEQLVTARRGAKRATTDKQ